MSRSQIYYYTYIPVDFEFAAGLLSGPPTHWLPIPAVLGEGGWAVDLRADGALPGSMAARRAYVQVGDVRPQNPTSARCLWRSLTWRSATSDQLFPVMEADLELAALDGACQLSFMGSYRPPLAVVGSQGDRLFGRRVAEACTRRFVLDVADRLCPLGVAV